VVSPSLIASLAGLLKAKLTRPRVRRVLWVQDLYSAGLIQKYGPVSPIAVFFRGVERLAVRLADRVVVIHPRFAHFAQESLLADPEKIAVVRNWSHFSVQANESSDSVRRRYGIDLSAILVCHAGNMGFKQALSNVVSAAKLALEQGVGTEFLLVGNGNQRLDLENQAAGLSNLRFIDSVPDVELANLLAAADVLLINELGGMREMALPSKFTTYLTAGKPILLASDKESIMAEELALSGSGIRVEAESPQALVDGISKLISGGDDIGQLVRNGKDFQKKYLSEEAALNAFMQILG
jgi:colanic acid biosynthesis glycosyl transferase WcaI